jgi:hypothetical protein
MFPSLQKSLPVPSVNQDQLFGHLVDCHCSALFMAWVYIAEFQNSMVASPCIILGNRQYKDPGHKEYANSDHHCKGRVVFASAFTLDFCLVCTHATPVSRHAGTFTTSLHIVDHPTKRL